MEPSENNMDRTLDPIRPSEGRNELSYMYARDPSILAYAQRPIPSEKKNLISVYEEEESVYPVVETCSTIPNPENLQTIKVYLRLKPLPRKIKLTKEEADAYQIINSTTLLTKLPSLDHTSSSFQGAKMADTVFRKFTFSHTFGPETTQFQLFEEVIQQKMVDFLAGQNATVMTYGTTNSGKSYTLQGTTTSPGIIPRSLEFVFSNINTRPTPSYKPTHNSDVVSLSPVDRAQELEAKNKLLTFATVDKHAYINAYRQMQKLLQEESPIRPSQACDAHYSVWVSFAEIYNENIYDLLSNDCHKRRPLLKLGTDSRGQAFIKGLKTVCVNSGSEAYQVLMAGQYNLKVAATALNARSSRSHCIFTIRLLKYYVENMPSSVEVSTFAFCDLAGSERLKKTLNVGERLKEAQNINTSLLVLGRCLKAIYDGQTLKQRHELVGPFRESKLTRLFQRALSGKEQIVLIVNVNPLPNLYIETQNVLNFSAIAKKIVVEPKKVKRRVSSSGFSQIVAHSIKSSTNWTESELISIEQSETTEEIEHSVFLHQDEYDELLAENKSLKKEISALKASMFNKDLETRQELADLYTAMMKKLETDWKNRIKDVEEQQEEYHEWSVKKMEAFYEVKISELTSRKRRRSDHEDDDEDDERKSISELEIENAGLTSKLKTVKQKIKTLRAENEVAIGEKNKLAFELGLTKEELKSMKTLLAAAQQELYSDEQSTTYIATLNSELNVKRDRIKSLKKFLDEAKEEYIRITSDAAEMERRLKERDEYVIDCQERIADLEELVDQVNVCLAENTREMEILEERANRQANLLREAEEKEEILQARFIESENTVQRLKAKIVVLENSIMRQNEKSGCTTTSEDHMLAGSRIKEEVLSESDGDLSIDPQKTSLPDGVVIKTDHDEILRIPTASFRNSQDGEVFVEVREVSSSLNNTELESESPTKLRARLNDSEAETEILKDKLSRSFEEIRSLKLDLALMKDQCNEITIELLELKAAQDTETMKTENLSVKITRDQASSPAKVQAVREAAVKRTESGSQTAAVLESDKISQTSFVDPSSDDKCVQTTVIEEYKSRENDEQLENLRFKYDELEEEYKEKVSMIEKLEEKLKTLQAANASLSQKSIDDGARIDELIQANASTTETLERDIAKIVAEKASVEKILGDTEKLLKSLENEIISCRNEHEVKISSIEKELKEAREREGTQLQLEKAHACEISELVKAHASEITELAKSHTSEITELAKGHMSEITELEKTFHRRSGELEARIDELTKSYERSAAEKEELEKKLKANTTEIEALQKRISQANKKDQEKDDELRQLQKALKNQLSSDVHDKMMEKELKEALKELTETRETLRRTDDLYQRQKISSTSEIKNLETQISLLESKIKSLESRQSTAQHEKAELECLRRENEELVIAIGQKDREMDSFKKNRDETNAKWENLMKSKQEELERSKNEIKRFQELFHRMPTTPRDKGAKGEEDKGTKADDTSQHSIAVVDLSSSDTKRATRRTALPPPASCPSLEPKKSTRKKRLYQHDEVCIDLESCEEIPPTPPSQTPSTRSLRTRKKQVE